MHVQEYLAHSLNICALFLTALFIDPFALRSQNTRRREHTRCVQHDERNDLLEKKYDGNEWHKSKSHGRMRFQEKDRSEETTSRGHSYLFE